MLMLAGAACGLTLFSGASSGGEGRAGTASWYSYESALREGTSGVMANGQRMDDEALTAASWEFPLGTSVLVRCQARCRGSSRAVRVTITDRGPAKRLYREGRILDLSPAAFRALAPLEYGLIPISVEGIR